MMLSDESRILAGVLLLSLVTVETGGLYLLKVVRGHAGTTAFQEKFARAGHAHAGVLLVVALLCQLFADATSQTGVAVAALVMPAGFFLSSVGAGREQPNRLFPLVPLGGLVLAAGLTSLGVGLLTA